MAKQQVVALDELDSELIKQIEPDWRKMMTCIQCGSCTVSCPSGHLMDYAPRELWRLMRMGMRDELVNSRTFWLCTQCYACTVRCPRGIITSDAMLNLRRWALAEGLELPAVLPQLKESVETTHNILHEDNASRLIWSENLEPVPEQLRDVRRGQAEVLLFAGCVGAMYPMAYSIPQSFVQILEQAGVTYTNLGADEWCCGYPLYGAGMKDLVAELAEHNLKRVVELGSSKLVATCPSCYYAWTHVYPDFVELPPDLEIMHATQYLARLLEEGRIDLGPVERIVTYHDPCDLGRKGGVIEAPRRILAQIPGLRLVEMAENRDSSHCCGGGGNLETFAPEVSKAVSRTRIRQAAEVGAQTVVSACQQCERTLANAARAERLRIRVKDITELVLEAIG